MKAGAVRQTAGGAKIAAGVLGDLLGALNTALAFAACREASEREQLDESSIASGLDLAKGLVFPMTDKLQKSSLALREALFGNIIKEVAEKTENTLAKEVAEEAVKAISTKIAIWTTVFDVVAAGTQIVGSIREGDGDAGVAHMVSGIGAGITLAALVLSGPVGWMVAGVAIGLAGSVGATLLKDTPFDKLVNHSAFGLESAKNVFSDQEAHRSC